MKPGYKKSCISMLASALLSAGTLHAAVLDLAKAPLFLSTGEKANVLVILDNSNSMDEAANGSAVGSADPSSKSEIARKVVRSKASSSDPDGLIDKYMGRINMGLMAYQQAGISLRNLHNSPYDVSYDPAHYDPTYTGPRDSIIKKYRTPNLSTTTPDDYLYYNVALPFYANANFGTAFCYSPTADFDNGSEDPLSGPWDRYRCFHRKSGTSDALPAWRNSASESAAGYSGFWFESLFSPTDSDYAQNILDFGRFLAWNWVSLTWFANTSPGRGYLHVPIALLDSSQAAKLNKKLATSQFSVNRPTHPDYPLQNAGLTPIEGTLLTARDYFNGNLTASDEGGPQPAPPNSCGKNFVVLLTDGLPSTDKNGNTIADPATAILDAAAAADALHADGVETYVVGFALPYGVDPTTLDTIAVAGGTGSAYYADDPTSLTSTFDTIFEDILDKTGAAASAATNSTSLMDDTKVYQARFNSGDWSGQLLSRTLAADLSISTTWDWDAGVMLDTISPDDRVILTVSRDTGDGIPFRWSNISSLSDTKQKDYLNDDGTGTSDGRGADRVSYLRGASVSGFRTRSSRLGDIVHSAPFYVGSPDAGHWGAEYFAFRSTYHGRNPVLYVGANDGMLHGFAAADGKEVLAYVPGSVYRNLSKLTHPNYGSSSGTPAVPHEYFVDGTPMVADAYWSGSWRTVLVGGLNAGGQGYYALDITDPSTFSEANASNIVLWEFTDENDADLGYTFNQPPLDYATRQSAQIRLLNNGKWAVILGNGYNSTEADGHASTTGHAYLYVLYLQGGVDGNWDAADYVKVDTGAGSTAAPNGLSTPLPVDHDGDGDVDYVYAGDLQGNLWRFDLTNMASVSVTKIYEARDGSGNRQPITTAPVAIPHPDGGYVVGFGTGKYLEHADIADTHVQTFYAVWDDLGSSGFPISGRGSLVAQSVLDEKVVGSYDYRLTTNNGVDYTSEKGWYMDLPTTGERIAYNPIARDGRFVFTTLIPDTGSCSAGGTSWLMELDYLTGSRLNISPFDVDMNGRFTSDDKIAFDYLGAGADPEYASGVKSNIGILPTPTVIDIDNSTGNEGEGKILSGSKGELEAKRESKSSSSGRVSWREIIKW